MKKLLELIKKLLGGKPSSNSSGFTLIELLVVIAILGILAAGLLVAVDPVERIRYARDTTAINRVAQFSRNVDVWSVNNGSGGVQGTIPVAADLTLANGLQVPANSTPYAYSYLPDATSNWYVFYVTGLQSKKVKASLGGTTATVFLYSSQNGKSCNMVPPTAPATITAATTCP